MDLFPVRIMLPSQRVIRVEFRWQNAARSILVRKVCSDARFFATLPSTKRSPLPKNCAVAPSLWSKIVNCFPMLGYFRNKYLKKIFLSCGPRYKHPQKTKAPLYVLQNNIIFIQSYSLSSLNGPFVFYSLVIGWYVSKSEASLRQNFQRSASNKRSLSVWKSKFLRKLWLKSSVSFISSTAEEYKLVYFSKRQSDLPPCILNSLWHSLRLTSVVTNENPYFVLHTLLLHSTKHSLWYLTSLC